MNAVETTVSRVIQSSPAGGESCIQRLTRAKKHAVDLYWLAFLLTGHREASADMTIQTLNVASDSDSFFSTWMLAWSRRLVIAKALASIRENLRASIRQTKLIPNRIMTESPDLCLLDHDPAQLEIERALSAIAVFPRCALLLTIFEGMSLEDAAIVLEADKELVQKGQIIGLCALAKNLTQECKAVSQ